MRCYLCHRDDDGSGVVVSLDGAIRGICSRCWDHVSPDIPVNYMSDEDDDD